MSGVEVSCDCGRVGLELSGEPIAEFYCHCDDCQRFFGAAYVATVMYPAEGVRVSRGQPQLWVPKVNHRHFCRDCGTRLFSEIPGAGVRGVNAYLLPPGEFQPMFHIQCQHAQRPIQDALSHYLAYPAAFGGSDQMVDW